MGDPAFVLQSDRILPTALSINLAINTVETGYPLSSLHDGDPATPFKVTTAGPFRIDVDRGASGTFGLSAIFNHNLDAGLAVAIKTAANAGFSGLTSDTLTIPADHEDGMSVAPFVNLSARTNRYARLDVTGTNNVEPAIGEWWLTTTIRTLSPVSSFRWGFTEHERRVSRIAESDVGTGTAYDYGVTRRFLSADFRTDAVGLAQLRFLFRSVKGNVVPFVWIPDRDVNEAWLVRFAAELNVDWLAPDVFDVSLTFDEVSAGIPVREVLA